MRSGGEVSYLGYCLKVACCVVFLFLFSFWHFRETLLKPKACDFTLMKKVQCLLV